MNGRRSTTRLWLLAFIGFWVLFAGWTFATPYNGGLEESEHVVRAAGVAHGQIFAKQDVTGGFQDVPRSIQPGWCFENHYNVAASCEKQPGGVETVGSLHTTAARNNPIYYALTGWPLGIWPDWHGIYLSRLLHGAAMAALLACAVVASARWVRHRALVPGIVVGLTPILMSLGGAYSPMGVEVAAGLALFAALLALLHEQQQGLNRATLALAAVSATTLVTVRLAGLLWLVVILAAVLPWSRRERLRELARSSTVRKWSALVGAAVVVNVAWDVALMPLTLVTGDQHMSFGQILKAEATDYVADVANQMVGAPGWSETMVPWMVFVVWFMTLGLLLLGGFVLGTRSDRWRLVLVFLMVFGPLTLAEVVLANKIGFFHQGRYFLTGAVALPLLGAYILSRNGFTEPSIRWITRLLALLLTPIQFFVLVYTLARWSSGAVSLNPFNGSWHPPYGAAVPLVLGLLGAIGTLVTYWVASRIPPLPQAPHEEEPTVGIPAQPVGVGHV